MREVRSGGSTVQIRIAAIVGVLFTATAMRPASAGSGQLVGFTPFDFPGAEATDAFGVNSNGAIVGGYSALYSWHGFLYESGHFTTVDNPSTPAGNANSLNGINDVGTAVGAYGGSRSYGFGYSAGNFTPINVPNGWDTNPNGINDAGDVVGQFIDASWEHGFLLSGVRIRPLTSREPLEGPPRSGSITSAS